MNKLTGISVVALTVFAAAITAQVQKGKTQPLETKTWMKNVNGPQCSNLAKLLKAGPADDKQWADVVMNAQMLNEAGYVLMADGRCPDKVWADATKMLKDGSAAILKAAESKNTAEAMTALNNSVLAACKSCHGAHRKQ